VVLTWSRPGHLLTGVEIAEGRDYSQTVRRESAASTGKCRERNHAELRAFVPGLLRFVRNDDVDFDRSEQEQSGRRHSF
jgi:hypothetical protein